MTGIYTPGVPRVGPLVQNGVTQVNPNGTYPVLTGYETAGFDTNNVAGQTVAQNPATVAAHVFDLACAYFPVQNRTGTSSAGAITLSDPQGTITTETLSTAAGSTYTLVLTNTFVLAASNVKVNAFLKTSTAGQCEVTGIYPAAGSCTISVLNAGAAAFNGSIAILFMCADMV
jgi:hypothetical protein